MYTPFIAHVFSALALAIAERPGGRVNSIKCNETINLGDGMGGKPRQLFSTAVIREPKPHLRTAQEPEVNQTTRATRGALAQLGQMEWTNGAVVERNKWDKETTRAAQRDATREIIAPGSESFAKEEDWYSAAELGKAEPSKLGEQPLISSSALNASSTRSSSISMMTISDDKAPNTTDNKTG